MGFDVNWGLLQPVDVGGMFQQGMAQGQAQRHQSDWAAAMRDYARSPNDPAVHDRLMQLDPERGMMLRDRANQRREASVTAKRGQAFDAAAGRYMVGMRGGNALLPFAASGDNQRQPNALAAFMPQPTGNALAGATPAPAPVGALGAAPTAAPAAPTATPAADPGATSMTPGAASVGPVAAPVASPAAGGAAEQAFQEMLAIDPVRAMQIESQGRDMVLGRLREADTAYEYAIRRIANVSDGESYQAAIADLSAQFAPLGINLLDHVPAEYPGPEGMRSLLMEALSAREQIAALDRQDRTTAYIDNMDADNARADRNTDSTIANRNERARIAAERERRIAAGGGRRGGGRGRGRGGRRVTARNPQTGETVELVNGQWVPAQ